MRRESGGFHTISARTQPARSVHTDYRVNGIMKLQRNLSGRAATLGWIACLVGWTLLETTTAHAYLLKSTRTGHRVRWPSSVITMHVDAGLRQQFGKEEVDSSLSMATDAWRGLPNVPDLAISAEPARGYRADERTNGIYLMNPWPFAKEQLAVTVSTYDLDGRMIGADILINGESSYALLPDGDDQPGMPQHDLAAVLTHEMGHVLGLDESPDDKTATMWPYIRGGDVHQRTLTEDDEQGVVEAYRGVALDAAAGGCTQASVVGVRSHSSTLQLASLILAALWIGRRRAHRHTRS
jgi:hypothetical protein